MTASEAIKELHEIRPRGGIIPQKRAEAIDVAINALEKQIPKKVVNEGKWVYKCPCCGGCAETDCGDAFYDYQLDYCNGCGQKLDWSDEE